MMTTYILVRPIVRADLLLRGPQQILTRRDSVTAQASVGKVSCQKHFGEQRLYNVCCPRGQGTRARLTAATVTAH
jgi:hypothetical protein